MIAKQIKISEINRDENLNQLRESTNNPSINNYISASFTPSIQNVRLIVIWLPTLISPSPNWSTRTCYLLRGGTVRNDANATLTALGISLSVFFRVDVSPTIIFLRAGPVLGRLYDDKIAREIARAMLRGEREREPDSD